MSHNNNKLAETYFVGKRDFKTFFVTICHSGGGLERIDGFESAEHARAWIRKRMASLQTSQPAVERA